MNVWAGKLVVASYHVLRIGNDHLELDVLVASTATSQLPDPTASQPSLDPGLRACWYLHLDVTRECGNHYRPTEDCFTDRNRYSDKHIAPLSFKHWVATNAEGDEEMPGRAPFRPSVASTSDLQMLSGVNSCRYLELLALPFAGGARTVARLTFVLNDFTRPLACRAFLHELKHSLACANLSRAAACRAGIN
jgi:hypothetical protein